MELSKAALELEKATDHKPLAENTRISYERHFEMFTAWCAKHDVSPLPAHPNAVINYLADIVNEPDESKRKSLSFVKITRNAISSFHERHYDGPEPNPIKDAKVQDYLKRVYGKTNAKPRGQAIPLRLVEVEQVCGYLDAVLHEATTHRMADRLLRKRALFRVGFDAAMRRSELSALRWSDVTFKADAMADVTIRESKTSPDPVDVTLGKKATRALHELRDFRNQWGEFLDPNEDDSVFQMETGHGVTMWIRKTCASAGLLPPVGRYFSGHSLRVGRAVTLAERGASVLEVKMALRHRTDRMANQYSATAMGTYIQGKYFPEDE